MARTKVTAAAELKQGVLTIVNRPRFDASLLHMASGQRYVVTVELMKEKRSDRQNRALHALLSPWADSEGHDIDDLKRDVLREVFGTREVVNAVTGEIEHVLVQPHTSKLNTEQFAFLMNRAVEIAAECGVLLELPDEYRQRIEDERRTA